MRDFLYPAEFLYCSAGVKCTTAGVVSVPVNQLFEPVPNQDVRKMYVLRSTVCTSFGHGVRLCFDSSKCTHCQIDCTQTDVRAGDNVREPGVYA